VYGFNGVKATFAFPSAFSLNSFSLSLLLQTSCQNVQAAALFTGKKTGALKYQGFSSLLFFKERWVMLFFLCQEKINAQYYVHDAQFYMQIIKSFSVV
jgi:hypothetical protein